MTVNCITECGKQFKAWMNSSNPDRDNNIPPDIQQTVYVTAIQNAGDQYETMMDFLDKRVNALFKENKDGDFDPQLDQMKKAQYEVKNSGLYPVYSSGKYVHEHILPYLDHNRRQRGPFGETSGDFGDPAMDFIIENWDSLVLKIQSKRKDVSEFLHEILRDIYT